MSISRGSLISIAGMRTFGFAAGLILVTTALAEPPTSASQARLPIFVEEGPQRVVHRADGTVVEVESQRVWRPMCGSDTSHFTISELQELAAASRLARAGREPLAGGVAAVGPVAFDLVFDFPSSMPEGAAEAFAEAEQFIESQFTDPVTVLIEVGFLSMGPGLLGSTDNSYVSDLWPFVRDGLQADMDASDSLQEYLPGGTTLPVRYSALSDEVTDETRVWISVANYQAAIGSASGYSAEMVFNSDFSWDFTPPVIDVGAHSFQDVVIHEVGHVLGFTSGADFRSLDVEMLDLYRFQMSDGDGTDYNPDSVEELGTTARLVDKNPPIPFDDDDVVTDLIFAEYRMSDGSPYQSAHFHAQNPGIYLMDPSLATQETFYPDFFRVGDLNAFDAIGWDFPPDNTSCVQALELACGSVRHYDNSTISNPPAPAYSCGSGTLHDGTLWFEFNANATSARLSTCGSREPDSTIAVYEGDCASLVEIGCSEDYPCETGAGLSSICLADLTIGQTYYVQVSAATTFDRGVYSLELDCTCDPVCADLCCQAADAVQLEPDPIDKNRYVSLIPGNPGKRTAIRVILSELHSPTPPNLPADPPPDFSSYDGQIRWVGPPETFVDTELPLTELRGAKLQCTPHFMDWGDEGVIHVYGPEVAPSSIYDVQVVDEACEQAVAGEDGYSESLILTTARWGDVAAPFQDPGSVEPPSQPNVLDIASIVDHLRLVPVALSKTRVQLQPADTDPVLLVNVLDVASAVDAVKGRAYPHTGPVDCPP